MVVSPPLDIGDAIEDVCDSGGGYKEEDLAPVILVADGYKFHIINGGGEDEAGGRRKGAQNVLEVLLGLHDMASLGKGLAWR